MKFCIVVSVYFTFFTMSAQDTVKYQAGKNSVFTQVLGNAGLFSVNYERFLLSYDKIQIAGRIGFSYIPPFITHKHLFYYPAEINLLYGKKGKLEFGMGITPVFNLYKEDISKYYDIYTLPVFNAGYRSKFFDERYFFKINLYYFSGLLNTNYIINWGSYYKYEFPFLWFGIGIGYNFN